MRKTILSLAVFFVFSQAHSQTCPGLGSIAFQRWDNLTGTAVSSLTGSTRYPASPTSSGTLASFETPANLGNNLGVRVYGYICPPVTGNYTFWIASDNSGELWLSTTTNPTGKVRIAYNTSSASSRQWSRYPTQKSVSIALTAGTKYYVEALMKESTGSDNLAVGWAKPGQSTTAPSEVIPGSCLSVNNVITVELPTAPANLTATNITSTSFTLSWTASTSPAGITGYDIYRNGTKINTANMIGTSYSVTGCAPNSMYALTVKAKDPAGYQSVASSTLNATTLPATAASEVFTVRTVIANQRMPHDLVYGPDGNIWYTERFGGTVSFVNPSTGAKRIVLSLGAKMARVSGQDGLMGLALHPQFGQGSPYVYISYTYQSLSATVRRTRIERYTYDFDLQTLGSAVTVLENIPGSNDHNSARLSVGPDLKLYYSAGDMGAGQFDNISRIQNAQALNVYEGKILRLNTDTAAGGSWIPADNPYLNAGVPTAVYSLGHRNPQGLVWGNVNGADILYSTEHGPYSDDEVNIIERARNYGWPQVAGFCDGNYNGRNIGGFNVVNEQANCTTLNAKEPMRSIFPSANPPTGGDNMMWPSMAPSGTDFYGSTAIPGWQNSLLIATLKAGTITRYKLSNDGLAIISDTINYFRGLGRFRDVVVSADGLKFYVACDSSGSTSGPTGNVTSTPANPGSILEFTFSSGILTQQIIRQEQGLTLNNTENKSLDVYPNPANQFLVVYNYAKEKGIVSLYDLNGRLLKHQQLVQLTTRINTADLNPGMYILKVTDARKNSIRTEKILVAH